MELRNIHKRVSISVFIATLATSPEFKLGVEAVYKDKDITCDHISYERGRAFALFSKLTKAPKPAWRNNKLSKAAQERLHYACISRWVI